MKRVAFQGELGAFSELATYEYFGNEVEVIPKETFADIFDAVSSGEADHGIIPIQTRVARHPFPLIVHREGHITPMSEGVDLRQRRARVPPLLARFTVSFLAYRFDQYLCHGALSYSKMDILFL